MTPQLLQGQVIGLIGASSGIGAAMVHALYEQGANVAIGARRLPKLRDVAQESQTQYPQSQGQILPLECDVTSRESVQSFCQQTCDHYGRDSSTLDALICCAGVMYFTKMKNVAMDQWDQTIDVNCKGATNCLGAVIPTMMRARNGKIIFVTSDAGIRDFPNLAVYCASKRFVETLVEITRRELVGTGVTLHTLQPGDVQGTELILQNTDTEASQDVGVEIGKPVGEGFSRNQLLDPKDVAAALVSILTAPPHVAINSILIEPRDQE